MPASGPSRRWPHRRMMSEIEEKRTSRGHRVSD
jgi:hypothetical protein